MTAQIQDTIFYEAREYWLSSDPLASYSEIPNFMAMTTANCKGYTAVWVIVNQTLFLVALAGVTSEISTARGLQMVFPECQAPVKANWYSGELKMQRGRVVVPQESDPLGEYEDILILENGKVVGDVQSINRKWRPEHFLDPMCYQPVEGWLHELGGGILARLKAANIHYIADLARLNVTSLHKSVGLDLTQIMRIEEKLAKHGFAIGSSLPGWDAGRKAHLMKLMHIAQDGMSAA